MLKRIIALALTLVLSSNFLVFANKENTENKLYCLSGNEWADSDKELYKGLGIELENYETNASYSWTENTDADILKGDTKEEGNEYKGNKLLGGGIKSGSGNENIWSSWNREASATAVLDLKDVYWVSRVDAWTLSKNPYMQAGAISIKIGETLDNLKSVGEVLAEVPKKDELNLSPNGVASRATVEITPSRARFIEVTFNTLKKQTTSQVVQMIISELSVFGYLEKPVIEVEEVEEITPEKTIFSDENPVLDDRNTYIIDLGAAYEVSETIVTQYNSNTNGLLCYDVYLSTDGEAYSLIGSAEPANKISYKLEAVSYDITQKMYARYVKLVMHKEEKKEGILINRIEVIGRNTKEEERVDKEATYSYYTQHPYQTADDIRLQDTDCKKLMDGDKNTTIFTNEKWASVVVDLKEAYQIGNVDVYSLADGNNFLEGCEIRYSLDGKRFFTYTYYVNKNERTGGIVKSSFSGMPGRNARFLKIILQSADNRIAVSEIEINGYKVKQGHSESLQQVPLRIEMKGYVLAHFDWSTYNTENTSRVALYVEKMPFTNTMGLTPVAVYESFDDAFKYKYATKTPLEPETTYYFAVTPFDLDGNELKEVTPVKVTTQGVLPGRPRDVFSIVNHPSYRGGATKGFGSYTAQMKLEAARLMGDMGTVNYNRNFEVTTDNATYTNEGIVTMWSNSAYQAIAQNSKNLYGNYLFSNGNEKDLTRYDVNKFLNEMTRDNRMLKNLDERIVYINPVLGGTEIGSLQWLDDLYRAGSGAETRLNFDAMDVHLYPKTGDKQIPGLPTAVPELMIEKIASVREVMAKYGDGDKPFVSTETGFLTSDVDGYSPAVSYDRQRDYVVRAYLIFISQNVATAWYYDFHDDGLDPNEKEHNWGLINYFGVPKPSYYGYYNLSQQMRNTEYLGAVNGLSNPYYGFEFFDETKNKHISAVWAADAVSKIMEFETISGKDEVIEVIGSDGGFECIKTVGGKASVMIDAGPVFIYSENGIKPTSIDVSFESENPEVVTIKGGTAEFTFTRKNLAIGSSGRVDVLGVPQGVSVRDTRFDSSSEKIKVIMDISQAAVESSNDITMNIILDNGVVLPVTVRLIVKPSIDVKILPYPEIDGNFENWKIAAYCTNTVNVPVEDIRIGITNTTGISVNANEALIIDSLQPGETKVLYFDVTEPPKEYGAEGTFIIETGGQKRTFDRNLNFSACVNDGITPLLDGVLSPGEWDGAQALKEHPSSHMASWKGEDDLSFKLYTKWDDKNLYIAVDIKDNVFYQPYTGTNIWSGDSVQIGLDVKRENGVGLKTPDYFEFGFAGNDKNELMSWIWISDIIIKKEVAFTALTGAFKRTDDGHTVYEVSIPWTYFIESGIINENDCFGLSAVVNDNDGSGRTGYIKYMQGISDGKDANRFADMVLIKK